MNFNFNFWFRSKCNKFHSSFLLNKNHEEGDSEDKAFRHKNLNELIKNINETNQYEM